MTLRGSGALRIAVVGATGAVGREMLAVLEQRRFPVSELVAFASPKSEGAPVHLGGKTYLCRTLKPGCFQGVDLAFFDASDAVSKAWVPEALGAGAWVIDNSATSRMDVAVPLLVPEVNGRLIAERVRAARTSKEPTHRLIAGPNCTTAGLVLPLDAIRARWGLKRVVVSTYQSTSGAGAAAMDELSSQTLAVFNQKDIAPREFVHRIAFNCIPQIGGVRTDGYTSEERKLIEETRKILDLPDLRMTATAVRVPTYAGHGESVNLETQRPFTLAEVRAALADYAGIQLLDEPERGVYPMNVVEPAAGFPGAAGADTVQVGRLRLDESVENGLNLWLVSDNLRKGAALNAVQIGEHLLEALA